MAVSYMYMGTQDVKIPKEHNDVNSELQFFIHVQLISPLLTFTSTKTVKNLKYFIA